MTRLPAAAALVTYFCCLTVPLSSERKPSLGQTYPWGLGKKSREKPVCLFVFVQQIDSLQPWSYCRHFGVTINQKKWIIRPKSCPKGWQSSLLWNYSIRRKMKSKYVVKGRVWPSCTTTTSHYYNFLPQHCRAWLVKHLRCWERKSALFHKAPQGTGWLTHTNVKKAPPAATCKQHI